MVSFGKGQKHVATGYDDLITRPQERAVDLKGLGMRRCDSMESQENMKIKERFQER